MKTLVLGIPVICFGFALMFWHLRQWNFQQRTVSDLREKAFFGRQFKRRALIGSLIAIVGAVLVSLQWMMNDPLMFAWSVILLLVLLLVIACIALADLFYGILHVQHGVEAQKARRALITEYLRQRDQAAKAPSENDEST